MAREIQNTIYKVKLLNKVVFIEATSFKELCDWCAHAVAMEGAIISSVSEICKDGTTPRVSVLSSKEYKKAYKHYSELMNLVVD